MAEKTEQASPRKLQKAKAEGQIPRAKDLTQAISFAAGYFTMFGLLSFIGNYMIKFFFLLFNTSDYIEILINPYGKAVNKALCMYFIVESLKVIYVICTPICLASLLAGVIGVILTSGINVSTKVLSFKLSRFNFIQNLKSRFSKDSLVNILKQFVTAGIVTLVIYNTVTEDIFIYKLAYSFRNSTIVVVSIIIDLVDQLVRKTILIIIIVGLIDAAYQMWSYNKKMMMDKQEAKQDYKEAEGDPEVKGKRKEFAKELVYSDGPLEASKKATAVITNPTHIAVTIHYDVDNSPVPIITGKGHDEIAARMIEVALDSNVTVKQDPDLAWKLFYLEIGSAAPEETFQALANILKTIESVQKKLHTQ